MVCTMLENMEISSESIATSRDRKTTRLQERYLCHFVLWLAIFAQHVILGNLITQRSRCQFLEIKAHKLASGEPIPCQHPLVEQILFSLTETL